MNIPPRRWFILAKKGGGHTSVKCGFRGCQRKVILLKNTGSEIFDEAYFIISEKIAATRGEDINSGGDMIAEARKIVAENRILYPENGENETKNKYKRLKWYLCGLFSGILGSVALALIYYASAGCL